MDLEARVQGHLEGNVDLFPGIPVRSDSPPFYLQRPYDTHVDGRSMMLILITYFRYIFEFKLA